MYNVKIESQNMFDSKGSNVKVTTSDFVKIALFQHLFANFNCGIFLASFTTKITKTTKLKITNLMADTFSVNLNCSMHIVEKLDRCGYGCEKS